MNFLNMQNTPISDKTSTFTFDFRAIPSPVIEFFQLIFELHPQGNRYSMIKMHMTCISTARKMQTVYLLITSRRRKFNAIMKHILMPNKCFAKRQNCTKMRKHKLASISILRSTFLPIFLIGRRQ